MYIQGVPKKKDISKFYSVCFTAHLIRNVENSFIHNLKIEINMFDPNTLPFPRDTITSALEKAASSASGACGHFVRNHAILMTF